MSTNISLTPELEKYAKTKVEQGLYSSVSELMRDALRLLRRQDIEYNAALKAELDKAGDEIDSGEISEFNMKEIVDDALKDIE